MEKYPGTKYKQLYRVLIRSHNAPSNHKPSRNQPSDQEKQGDQETSPDKMTKNLAVIVVLLSAASVAAMPMEPHPAPGEPGVEQADWRASFHMYAPTVLVALWMIHTNYRRETVLLLCPV
eukprot:3360591-Rhodomonas_salina.1